MPTIPIQARLKAVIDAPVAVADIDACIIFRCVGRRAWGNCVSEKAGGWIIRAYATLVGIDHPAAHDLRWICARMFRSSGGELELIKFLPGQRPVETAE